MALTYPYPLLFLSIVQNAFVDDIQISGEKNVQQDDAYSLVELEQKDGEDNRLNPLILTPEQLFNLSHQLAVNGAFDEAIRLLLALEKNPNPEFRAEARARIARILLQKGELRASALMFQRLLDEKPDSAGVRVELANILLKLGDEKGATRQLQRAAAVPGLSDDVQRALGRATSGIRSNKKFIGGFSIGLAPDSNINRATQNAQIDIFGLPFQLDEAALATSGIGLTAALSGTYRKNICKSARLNISASGNGDFYRRSVLNDFTISMGLGVEIFDKNRSISLPITVGQRYIGQNKIFDFYSLAANLRFRIDRKSQLQLMAGVNYLDYSVRTDLSGRILRLGLSYERSLSPTLSFRINGNISDNETNSVINDTRSVGGEIIVGKDLGAVTVFSRARYFNTKGEVNFVPFADIRNVNLYSGELGIILRKYSYKGFSPQLLLRRVENDSNIPIFDFSSDRFEASITRTF